MIFFLIIYFLYEHIIKTIYFLHAFHNFSCEWQNMINIE